MKWISVEDRLPDSEDDFVIVFCPDEFPKIGQLTLECGPPKGISISQVRSRVTHWMPLPEKPND